MRTATPSRRQFTGLALSLVALTMMRRAHAAAPRGPLSTMRAALYPFATAPFPYHGVMPDGTPFLDVQQNGRLAHSSPRGGIYFEDQTYMDNRVLVAMPGRFDLRRRAAIVVFFHGNGATLQRDVVGRQHVLDQLQISGLNAALVAPQLAVDALDSSAGKFWQPGGFARFMDEAANVLAAQWGSRSARTAFARLPIILVAYSGGYDPLAFALALGGIRRRIHGVVLLDALVGETDKFAAWIVANHRAPFFFSAFSAAAADGNLEVERTLDRSRIGYGTQLPTLLSPGSITFIQTPGVDHDDYLTNAWTGAPLTWLFNRIPGFPR